MSVTKAEKSEKSLEYSGILEYRKNMGALFFCKIKNRRVKGT